MEFLEYLKANYQLSESFKLKSLDEMKCKQIPISPGVYIVTIPDNKIEITNNTIAAIEYKGRSLLYPKESLDNKYLKTDGKIIYIGKGDNLFKRVRSLVRYGKNEVKNHRGGRAIWQLKDSWELELQYFICDNPRGTENELLNSYEKEYGVLPLSNRIK